MVRTLAGKACKISGAPKLTVGLFGKEFTRGNSERDGEHFEIVEITMSRYVVYYLQSQAERFNLVEAGVAEKLLELIS